MAAEIDLEGGQSEDQEVPADSQNEDDAEFDAMEKEISQKTEEEEEKRGFWFWLQITASILGIVSAY